jgi:hypothetical protein
LHVMKIEYFLFELRKYIFQEYINADKIAEY